jgi:hypothetical protein
MFMKTSTPGSTTLRCSTLHPATFGLSILALAIHSTLALADPASTSAYQTDAQKSHVEDATSRGVKQVNFITCLMHAMRPDAMVNEGNYIALVDGSKCENDAEATGEATTTFNTAYVNATRTSNSDPMITRLWLEEEHDGQKASIFVHVSASEAPSASNVYGKFRMDYCGTSEGTTSCLNNGYLEGSDTGMRYFENESTEDGTPSIKAVQLNAIGTASGSGRMSTQNSREDSAFDFAYNTTLFRRRDQNDDDQCFSRDASDPDTGISVWRYGLYDATTGARVDRSSGFQIEFVNGGETYRGYLGYWGLSLPPDAMNALTNGDTVQKVDYSGGGEPTRTDYSVVKAAGKMTKHTKHTRTLHEIDKVKFSVFVGNNGTGLFAGAHANTSYELYWDEASNSFKASAEQNCGMNGCSTSQLSPEKSVSVSFWASQPGVQGFSNSLGGEVFVALHGATTIASSDAVSVVYRVQDLVYPSQMPATLYCLRDCPTQASLTAFFAPNSHQQRPFVPDPAQNFGPATAGSQIVYHPDAATAILKDASNAPVVFTDEEALEQSQQYRNGIRSGKLFTDLGAAECNPNSGTYCEVKVNEQEVYYQWETGAGSYNQFAAVKDASGAFLQFEAPLQVNFHVPDEASYGAYRGQNILLQYSGFGELYGIPGYCVSPATNAIVSCEGGDNEEKRYVAAFSIPFNSTQGRVTLGETTYLVKWLDREIRFANKDPSVCAAAGLTLPSGMVLPTAAELQNPSDPASALYIGAKPVVTAAPRVIHGEVKY